MRSNRRLYALGTALAVAVLAGCTERDPFDPADHHYRPQLAVVPGPVVIDFEGLANFEPLTDQYADRGVLFSTAAAIDTSRSGLNREAADPRSGGVMAWNCPNRICGALGMSFPDGATAVGAYVTGFEPVTLTCFDTAGAPLGSEATPGRNAKGNADGLPLHIFLEVSAPGIASCELRSEHSDMSFVIDDLTFTPQPQEVVVQVDVQQGSVNLKSRGLLPVALLGDAGFDPVADVNLTTLTLGDGSDQDTPVARRRNGTFMASGEDVNGDGHRDLVLHFSTPSLVANGDLTAASTELVLRGATRGGVAFAGADAVNVH